MSSNSYERQIEAWRAKKEAARKKSEREERMQRLGIGLDDITTHLLGHAGHGTLRGSWSARATGWKGSGLGKTEDEAIEALLKMMETQRGTK